MVVSMVALTRFLFAITQKATPIRNPLNFVYLKKLRLLQEFFESEESLASFE